MGNILSKAFVGSDLQQNYPQSSKETKQPGKLLLGLQPPLVMEVRICVMSSISGGRRCCAGAERPHPPGGASLCAGGGAGAAREGGLQGGELRAGRMQGPQLLRERTPARDPPGRSPRLARAPTRHRPLGWRPEQQGRRRRHRTGLCCWGEDGAHKSLAVPRGRVYREPGVRGKSGAACAELSRTKTFKNTIVVRNEGG